MSKYSDRYVYRVMKDNEILKERCERYFKDINTYKEFNNKVVQENLNLEKEIINLRKIINIYEDRQDRVKN